LAGKRAGVRDHEAFLELTYQAQIIPDWIVQSVHCRPSTASGHGECQNDKLN
jgi:hypothetical protein